MRVALRDQCHLVLDIEDFAELEVCIVLGLGVTGSHVLFFGGECGEVFVELFKTSVDWTESVVGTVVLHQRR